MENISYLHASSVMKFMNLSMIKQRNIKKMAKDEFRNS